MAQSWRVRWLQRSRSALGSRPGRFENRALHEDPQRRLGAEIRRANPHGIGSASFPKFKAAAFPKYNQGVYGCQEEPQPQGALEVFEGRYRMPPEKTVIILRRDPKPIYSLAKSISKRRALFLPRFFDGQSLHRQRRYGQSVPLLLHTHLLPAIIPLPHPLERHS